MSRQSEPSQRQQQVADAVRDQGSVVAAAKALRISRVTVETTLARYHTAVCDRRIEELEAEVERLRERDAMRTTTTRLETVVGRLEKLAVPVSHRRLVDGGARVKDQRRRVSNGASGSGNAAIPTAMRDRPSGLKG